MITSFILAVQEITATKFLTENYLNSMTKLFIYNRVRCQRKKFLAIFSEYWHFLILLGTLFFFLNCKSFSTHSLKDTNFWVLLLTKALLIGKQCVYLNLAPFFERSANPGVCFVFMNKKPFEIKSTGNGIISYLSKWILP